MEITPTIITIGISLATIIIGVVIWLVRLEAMAKQAKEDIEDIYDNHIQNTDIHHDARWLEDKFSDIKAAIERVENTVTTILTAALKK